MMDNGTFLDEITVGGDVEPGTHHAVLVELSRFSITSSGEYDTPAGEEIPKLLFVWATDDGTRIEGSTSLATGPRSKLRAWCKALGVDLSKPGTIKLSDLVGREALVNVELNDRGYIDITSVVAMPNGKRTK